MLMQQLLFLLLLIEQPLSRAIGILVDTNHVSPSEMLDRNASNVTYVQKSQQS